MWSFLTEYFKYRDLDRKAPAVPSPTKHGSGGSHRPKVRLMIQNAMKSGARITFWLYNKAETATMCAFMQGKLTR